MVLSKLPGDRACLSTVSGEQTDEAVAVRGRCWPLWKEFCNNQYLIGPADPVEAIKLPMEPADSARR